MTDQGWESGGGYQQPGYQQYPQQGQYQQPGGYQQSGGYQQQGPYQQPGGYQPPGAAYQQPGYQQYQQPGAVQPAYPPPGYQAPGYPQPGAGLYLDPVTGLMIPQGTEVASVGYRIGAYFLAGLLWLVTLYIGYAIWGLISWANGQTPVQQVLGLRC